jgi:peptidyl-tRNA hydrolase
MDAHAEGNCTQLIQTLLDGKMLSHPGVQLQVERAVAKGDYSKLLNYVQTFPLPLAVAVRNINLAAHERAKCPFRPYPDRQDAREFLSGPLKFGFVNQFDDMFGIDWDTFSLPVIILGRVGSGKSQLIKYLLCQIFRKRRNFNVIIADLKGEYRHMLPIARHLKCLREDRIRINPLQVPNWMRPAENIRFFAEVFIKENWLAGTSENILIERLEYIYRKRGIFEGGKDYPTLHDLYRVILKEMNSRQSYRYRDILLLLLNRLHPYLFSETFNCRTGIPLSVWQTENIVLEMGSSFTKKMYCFVVSYLAGLRYEYNMKMGLTGSKLRTLFVTDEARTLLSAHRDYTTFGENYINDLVSKSREFGIGYLVSSQETSSFNRTIRALAYLKIAFPLTDGADLDFVHESLGLDEEQAAYIFKLPRFGQAVVRYGGYEEPFILAVAFFGIRKQVLDGDLKERMAGFYAALEQEVEPVKRYVPEPKGEILPGDALSLLYLLGREPFTKVSKMAEHSDLKSPAKVDKALKWLGDNLYVERKEIRMHRRGKPSSFAVLTRRAHALIGSKPPRGKGGFEHTLYQHMIAKKLKAQGMEAHVEFRMEGSTKSIDVLAKDKDGSPVAYEVSLELENLVKNIQDDLDAGAQKVVVVTKKREDIQKAKKKAEDEGSLAQVVMRVHFCAISDFYD